MNRFQADLDDIQNEANPGGRTAIPKQVTPARYFPALTVTDEEPPAVDDTAPNCETCNGHGFVLNIVKTPDGEQRHTSYCPDDCVASRRLKRDRLRRVAALYGDIPKNYRNYTLDSWAALPPALRAGRELAEILARQFIAADRHQFSMYEALQQPIARQYFGLKKLELLPPDYSVQSDNNARPPEWDSRVLLHPTKGQSSVVMNSIGSSLLFMGGAGQGKTGLAASIAFALADRGVAAILIHLPTFLAKYKATYAASYEGVSREQILAPIEAADVLIVDEFNMPGGVSEHDLNLVHTHIVTPRWNSETDQGQCKPLVLTTNHNAQSFAREWDSLVPAASRLFEMCHPVTLQGAPLRRKNAAN